MDMFGFSSTKAVNPEVACENISLAIISLWLDLSSLDINKFSKYGFFAQSLSNPKVTDNFLKEKLRLLTATGIICLYQATSDYGLIDQLVSQIQEELKDPEHENMSDMGLSLNDKAREYATIRTSYSAGEAGRRIEETFAKNVFGSMPPESDIDAKYALYKQLTSFERKAILTIKAALHEARQ